MRVSVAARRLHRALPGRALALPWREEVEEEEAAIPWQILEQVEAASALPLLHLGELARLCRAVGLGARLAAAPTEGVAPLASTLEGAALALRPDLAEAAPCRKELLGLAAATVEGHYAAPLPLPLSS